MKHNYEARPSSLRSWGRTALLGSALLTFVGLVDHNAPSLGPGTMCEVGPEIQSIEVNSMGLTDIVRASGVGNDPSAPCWDNVEAAVIRQIDAGKHKIAVHSYHAVQQ